MINASILVIDDNKSILSSLEILFQFEYKKVLTLNNPNQISSYPNITEVDIVLLDMNFKAGVNTGNEGLYWLKELKKKTPYTSVIMMTAYGEVDLAVKALKNGASDFVLKPWNNEKLLATIKSTYELHKSKKEVSHLKSKQSQLTSIINQQKNVIVGNSKALTQILSLTHKVAKTDVSVLITGENGTGKELIARELHQQSNRSSEVFISVDMGSISESLFESELFGHVKGSFTDAKEDRVGKFEAANGGTLFLDEIGNLSLQMQSKLLTAIQNRVIVKVGSNKPIPIDIRLICATNCNLQQQVDESLFREDLLYRINTIHIEVPSLRDRGKDILVLTAFFLKKFSAKYHKSELGLDKSAEKKLLEHSWPGNIRELQHTIERVVILSDDSVIKASDFLLTSKMPQITDSFDATLEEMEMMMIKNAIDKHEGNYSAAASDLGITRQTLYNKMKRIENK